MKEPVDHIIRPRLPWRSATEPAITECGHIASQVPTITRDEFMQRAKQLGQRRTMLMTCVTCADTAQRWPGWDEDPRKAIGREVEWESGWRVRGERHGRRLQDELLAITTLIAAHPEEFATILADNEQRRAWQQKKKDAQESKARRRPEPW